MIRVFMRQYRSIAPNRNTLEKEETVLKVEPKHNMLCVPMGHTVHRASMTQFRSIALNRNTPEKEGTVPACP